MGYWPIAGSAVLQRSLTDAHWDPRGLKRLHPTWQRLRSAGRSAGCGPACPVVWEEGRATPALLPDELLPVYRRPMFT